MNDQLNNDGTQEGTAQTEPILNEPLDDIDISNKGQRVAVLLVVILLVAAGIAWFVFYSQEQSKIEALEKLKTDFVTHHNAGYVAFWKNARLDLEVMKTNMDFEAKITEYLSVSSIAYTKHVKEKAMPLLESAIPKYRSLEAQKLMVAELKGVTRTLENLLDEWKKFTNEVALYEGYLDNRSKLTAAGEQWAGAQQQPKEDKFKKGAAKYVKTVNCILGIKGKSIIDYHPADLSLRIKDTCAIADEQAGWFKKVAFECLDYIGKEVEPDIIFEETVKKYAEVEAPNQDSKSVFGINNCLDLTRKSYESELSNNVAKAWAEYTAKKNELIKAIDVRIKEI